MAVTPRSVSLFAGVPAGSDPRAGMLLWIPHQELLSTRGHGQAALQWDPQHQQRCWGRLLPGLSDTCARYELQPHCARATAAGNSPCAPSAAGKSDLVYSNLSHTSGYHHMGRNLGNSLSLNSPLAIMVMKMHLSILSLHNTFKTTCWQV